MFATFLLKRDGTRLHVQIRQQIVSKIGRGELRPGEQVPTIRALAVELDVPISVIQQAFDELERDGTIVVLRKIGASRPSEMASPRQTALRLDEIASQAVESAMISGISPHELGRRVLEYANHASRFY